jgi:hypothetical protein
VAFKKVQKYDEYVTKLNKCLSKCRSCLPALKEKADIEDSK